jgi:D-glycero-D-manno-heptose 1,7-bisphosphate phosphatase
MPELKSQKPRPAVFLDRDGTMNVDIGYVSSPEQLEVYPWVAEAVRLINRSGMKAIVVTNQSGVARGFYDEQMLGRIHDRLVLDLEREGARLDAIYYCPHHPRIGDTRYRVVCECRKPAAGMLFRAQREHDLDLSNSVVIGDKASDVGMAARVGARSVLVLTGYGRQTLCYPELLPCSPDLVVEDLLTAVKRLLDTNSVCG